MSITISTDVFCDICKVKWVHGVVSNVPRIQQARKIAKIKYGWVRRWNRAIQFHEDVCPRCQLETKV